MKSIEETLKECDERIAKGEKELSRLNNQALLIGGAIVVVGLLAWLICAWVIRV
ncbi:MAG: hypothetical protein V4563_14165 [Pseudomonadota bacterium]